MKGKFIHIVKYVFLKIFAVFWPYWKLEFCYLHYSWEPTSEYEHYNGPDYGWCWLENLYNHTNLATYCYDDVHYDHRHGRFYSIKACNPDEDPKDKE